MFDDDERKQIRVIFSDYLQSIKSYRREFEVSLDKVPKDVLAEEFRLKYFELTGVELEFTVEEVMSRHYVSRWSRDWRPKSKNESS